MLSLFPIAMNSQQLEIFDEFRTMLPDINYIQDYGSINSKKFHEIISKLESNSFKQLDENQFFTSKQTPIDNASLDLHSFYNAKLNTRVQLLGGQADRLDSSWDQIKRVGMYSGMTLDPGCLYMKYDSIDNNIINAVFRIEDKIFSIYSELDFATLANSSSRTRIQDDDIKTRLDLFRELLNVMSEQIVDKKYDLFKMSNEPLSADGRVYGFTQFWTEVKYNFAFFDQVPDLDWDQVYLDYLPEILKDQSNTQYFKSLEKICALLEDGHTNIYPPNNLKIDYPELSLINIDGKAIVRNVAASLVDQIPRGTEITAVDQLAVTEYMKTNVTPYISSSTHHILMNESVRKLLAGEPNSEVAITFKNPDGTAWTQTLSRTRDSGKMDWAYDWPNNQLLEFRDLGNSTALIELNGFGNSKIVNEFEAIIDSLQSFDHFIIDLRNNGGGNSNNGYDILKYFADKSFLTSRWQTREHKASYKAWGSFYAQEPLDNLDDWGKESVKTFQGDYWHYGEVDTIQADKKVQFKDELIVLIGNNTASAAEDFLVALDDLGFGMLIGQATYGSTGQPLMIDLPRGASARICTKKDTYPDGREFVGFGIQPDVVVQKTVEDYISNKDKELDMALKLIHDRKN